MVKNTQQTPENGAENAAATRMLVLTYLFPLGYQLVPSPLMTSFSQAPMYFDPSL
jgi:hypothetical protein